MPRDPRRLRALLFPERLLTAASLLVISGGQTGVDRAALDAAIRLGIPCGGWCPRGRRAEDGVIASRYPLVETLSRDYRERTEANVASSDATLIVTRRPVRAETGTALTMERARALGKPWMAAEIADASPLLIAAVISWWRGTGGRILNVAGPRERSDPGIGAAAGAFLNVVFGGIRSAPITIPGNEGDGNPLTVEGAGD